VAVQGAAVPVSNPGLRSNCFELQLEVELMVHVKEALPEAPVVSFALTVTDEVPTVVGVPLIRPVELLMDNPAGRRLAE
jgi:hypothetical protein